MRLTTVLLTICTAAYCCRGARAETIIFTMSGTIEVSDADGLLPPEIVTGIPFTALLTYDLSTPDEFPGDPNVGSYPHAEPLVGVGLSVMTGGHTFETDPADDFVLVVGNDVPSPGFFPPAGDSFSLGGTGVLGPVNLDLQDIQFIWQDSSASAFSDVTLPTALGVGDFDALQITIFGSTGVASGTTNPPFFTVTANVDTLTLIPEPSTIRLGVTCIFLVCGWRTRSYRSFSAWHSARSGIRRVEH